MSCNKIQWFKANLQQGWRRPGLLNYLLLPLTLVYLLLIKARHSCYRLGIFQSIRLPVPVLVVGGIGVGGSGKSPLVISLVDHFKSKGYLPGVISRGYGGKSEFWPREVDHTTRAELVGDEPQFIFESCGVPVVVGANRVKSGRYLTDKLGCNILISDDGFQHFGLKRNIDIVVVDGEFGLGNGWCLPAGPLREPKSSIDRADILVINGQTDCSEVQALLDEENTYSMTMVLSEISSLGGNNHRNLSEIIGESVHVVAGIGNPTRFFSQLENLGIRITPHAFPDHHHYVEDDLRFGDDRMILMTEKDGIKCRAISFAKNIWIVPAKLQVDEGLFQQVESVISVNNY